MFFCPMHSSGRPCNKERKAESRKKTKDTMLPCQAAQKESGATEAEVEEVEEEEVEEEEVEEVLSEDEVVDEESDKQDDLEDEKARDICRDGKVVSQVQ